MSRFGVEGGLRISPEFATLLVGLSVGAAAYIGEIVRGGVLAIDQGQTDAAAALGPVALADAAARAAAEAPCR